MTLIPKVAPVGVDAGIGNLSWNAPSYLQYKEDVDIAVEARVYNTSTVQQLFALRFIVAVPALYDPGVSGYSYTDWLTFGTAPNTYQAFLVNPGYVWDFYMSLHITAPPEEGKVYGIELWTVDPATNKPKDFIVEVAIVVASVAPPLDLSAIMEPMMMIMVLGMMSGMMRSVMAPPREAAPPRLAPPRVEYEYQKKS